MYLRSITPVLERFSKLYPALGITGPRQSGKTTIAKTLFKHLPYVSLENIDTRFQAQNDPRAFLANYQQGAIFDEVQHVPELLSYLQEIADESPVKGRYVLTGSQNFALSHHVSQSLSGRIGMTTLLPLSLSELGMPININSAIFKGGYPGLHSLNMHPLDFYPSYIQTYIERDVRQLKNIENIGRFQTFLKLCAGRVGQILNLSSFAQDCGISHTTVRQWLNILEASYLIFFLQPFHQSFNKSLIKMPKLYFYDTGLACTLLGLEKESQLETHYLKGALFENLIVLEIFKKRLNQGLPANIYFWRDRTGHEVDLLAEWGGNIHAIEIKAGSTLQSDFFKNVQYFCELSQTAKGYLIYTGQQNGSHAKVKLVPINEIDQLTQLLG
ncbi:MAG: ATP-binding protein [Wolbachia endosymbiont of Polyergus mexicanus]|uniref:ATP-binding protein n=1 Tax=Wolbachia endosymbiont of Polyergus mexicanus TaxID=3171167 RepID=A0AAU7YJZ7_9RICK